MSTIYQQHDNAFSRVSSYAILKSGKPIGTVGIKYPIDGAGRLTMYLHIHGAEMVKGTASGYGYDKASAAFNDCCRKLPELIDAQADYPDCQKKLKQILRASDRKYQGLDWADAIAKQQGLSVFTTL